MARLNTTSQVNQNDLRQRSRPHRLNERSAIVRGEFRDGSTTPRSDESKREQWMSGGETLTATTKERGFGARDKQAQGKNRHQRARTISDMNFDIFADSDVASERGGPSPSKEKTTTPLKLARTNSLLLRRADSISHPPRQRTNRKSELYNYDKENDPLEEELDPQEPPSLSRNPSDASSTRRSPTRNRGGTQQFTVYRQPELVSDNESNEDESINSLDSFIVSDNEELSYHETSDDDDGDDETTEEQPQEAFSPPRPRRRLLRGRRPDPTADLIKALERSHKDNLFLEPSLPAAITIPSPTREERSRKLLWKDIDVSDTGTMNYLHLEDNDPSSQLQQDLHAIAVDLDSPSQSQQPIFQTPPSSPSKNRLRSPAKDRAHIPPTPYRESVDAFWNQEATNEWVNRHSPRKVETLLQEFDESDCEIDPESMARRTKSRKEVKTPSKTAIRKAEVEERKAALARKKSFDNKKTLLAQEFFKVLDDAASGGQVQKRAKETGGVRIIWSKTLQTTAGRASWKRERSVPSESSTPFSSETSLSSSSSPTKPKHYATIELAERIIDSEDRLINTLAHEYCHLANFIISNVHNNPHGASFKQWARRCKDALKDHPVYGGRVEVTTKHSYKIDYKYVWICVDCGQNYGRHSKSIDPTRSRCGKCQGILQQIKPKPRNVSPKKKPTAATATTNTRGVEDVVKVLEEVSLYN